MVPTGTSLIGNCKLTISELEKNSGSAKCRQAEVFDNWVVDIIDQLHIEH